jgi:putative membrane protein
MRSDVGTIDQGAARILMQINVRNGSGSASEEPQEMRRLSPWTLVYRFLVSLPALVIILLPVLRAPDANAWLSVTMLLLYGIFIVPLIVFQYLRFRYAVTPTEVVIHKGVLTRQHRNIPMDRIQNIEIEQRLVPRMLGMAKVKIETAGSTSTEGVIEYVSLAEARAIRAAVQRYQKSRGRRDLEPFLSLENALTGGPEPSASPAQEISRVGAEDILFRMRPGRVLLSGMFRFSLLYIVIIFSATEYLGLDPDDIARWIAGSRLEAVTAALEASPLLVITATVVMVALFSWITGILVNLNRFYGFRLSREGDKLHTRHGLLTLSETTIPLKKVQALSIRTNLLMSAFGWYRLELQTVGFDPDDRGYSVAAPFAELGEVQKIATSIRDYEMPPALLSVSPLMVRRTFVRYATVLILSVGGTAFLWAEALWGLVLLPLAYLLALQQYRHHGFAEDGENLYVRRGFLRRHLWVIPVERFQVFYLSQTIFQRRLGLSSIYVDTPGAGLLTSPTVVDLPAEYASHFVESLYHRFTAHFRQSTHGDR